jgi:hypothetical protein
MKNIKAKLPLENLVAALLTAWEMEGYIIGTDKYLQINTLLNKLPDDTPASQLKTFLTPLLTQNAQQQNDLYRLFDHILKTSIDKDIEHHEAVASEQKKLAYQKLKYKTIDFFEKRSGINLSNPYAKAGLGLLGLSFLGLLIVAFFYFKKQYTDVKVGARVGEVGSLCLKIKKGDEVVYLEPKNGSVKFAVNNQWRTDFCMQYMPIRVGADTITCYIKLKNGRTELVNIKISCFPNYAFRNVDNSQILQSISSKQQNQKISSLDTLKTFTYQGFTGDTAQTENMNGQYIEGISTTWEFGLGNAYFSMNKALIVLASLGLVLFLAWYWRYKNQKFTLAYKSDPTDFYAATLRIPTYKNIIFEEKFYRAVSEMRKRDADESRHLNVKETIHATIKNVGLIDFKYQQLAKTKQYLFLIELNDPLSNQTKFYDLIVQNLKENEVPIDRFFFDKNTLTCTNETIKQSISLSDLQHKYGGHQLVFITIGDILIENNAFLDWTKVFDGWRKKAIMTPQIPSNWRVKEDLLAQKFRLLPATMLGFAALTESLDVVEPLDFKRWITKNGLTEPLQIYSPNNVIVTLESQLITHKNGERDDRMMRWVAACALPPVLFWDWTFYVGDMLNDGTDSFFNSQNLAILSHLPWFEEGKIPEDIRGVLLAWLEKEHRFWYIEVIHKWSWVLILEENMPPMESSLWHGHRIQVILSHLLEHPKARERRQWELELDKLLRGDVVNDAVVVKYMQTRRTPLDNILSDRFRKFIQTKNAIIWRWRDWTWQAPSVFGVFLLTLFISYTEPVTTFNLGENITALAFSPDSEYFMVASGKGKIGMCAVKSGTIKQVETPENIVMLDVNLQEKIYAINTEGDVIIFEKERINPLKIDKKGLILAASVSSNSNKIGVGYFNKVAKIYDLNTSTPLFELKHDDAITDIVFSKNGNLIVTTSRDNTAKIWSNTGQLFQTLNAHKDPILCADISPDDKLLITGSRDNTAKLWDIATGNLIHSFEGHDYDVFDVRFSPNGQKIATSSGDRTAKLWSIEGSLLRTFKGHWDYVNAVVFSPNGQNLVTGDGKGVVKVWKIR